MSWGPAKLDVAAGASRIVYLLLLLFAGLTGALALVCLFDDELRGPGLVIAGIPAALVGGIALWLRHRARARRITIHAEGVRSGDTELRWGEIETLHVRAWQMQGAHVGGLGAIGAIAQVAANSAMRLAEGAAGALPYDSTQVTVRVRGAGRTITLRKWDARWAEAYAAIRAGVEPRLLATARAAGAASFGPVQVTRDGITIGKKVIARGELARVDVDRFWVTFRGRGKVTARVHISHVPNLHVMLELVADQFAATAASGGGPMRTS